MLYVLLAETPQGRFGFGGTQTQSLSVLDNLIIRLPYTFPVDELGQDLLTIRR
jgi:hypothetical protein